MKTKKTRRARRREAKAVRRYLEAYGERFKRRPFVFEYDDFRWRVAGPDPLNISTVETVLQNGRKLTVKVAFERDGTIWYFAADPTRLPDLLDELQHRPPAQAEALFSLFLTKDEREGAIGDFNERFGSIVDRSGRTAAGRWAYRQISESAWPLFSRKLSHVLSWFRDQFGL